MLDGKTKAPAHTCIPGYIMYGERERERGSVAGNVGEMSHEKLVLGSSQSRRGE